MKKAILLGAACLVVWTNVSYSQNARGHWEPITGDPYPDSVTQVVAGPGSLVYMATSEHGVFKSTDEGENWVQINKGFEIFGAGSLNIVMLAIGPKGDLLARDGFDFAYYSADGETWTGLGINISLKYPTASITALAFDSRDSMYIGTVGAGIYRVVRGQPYGSNCVQVTPPTLIPGVQYMLFDTQNRLIISYDQIYRMTPDLSAIEHAWPGKQGQIFRTRWGDCLIHGDSLYGLSDSLYTISRMVFDDLVVDSTGNLLSFQAWYQHPWKSTDRGKTWNEYINSSGQWHNSSDHYGSFTEATSYGFISGDWMEHQISVSYDSGMTFRRFYGLDRNSMLSAQTDRMGNLQAADMSGDQNDRTGGIWSSSDRGRTWRRRMPRQNIQGQLFEDGKYYAFDYTVPEPTPVYVSEDEGMTYKKLNVPSGVGGSGFYASPNGTLWLTYGSAHFVRSTDNGATWKEFAHFTDPAPWYWKIDSAYALDVIERGPYIWLSTIDAIHFTSDDGATWQVDTPHYVFTGVTGGRGHTIITHSSSQGVHWLNPGEDPDSSWIVGSGPFVENLDGNLLQFQTDYYYRDTQQLVRVSKSGVNLDTVAKTPGSLTFGNLCVDSSGDLFAASSGRYRNTFGLYRFVSAYASVSHSPASTGGLDVSVAGNLLTIESSSTIERATLIDMAGRSALEIPSIHASRANASIAAVPSGLYLVHIMTATGSEARKVLILR